jgi:tight adherence protein B
LVGRHPGVFAVLGAAGLGTAGAGLGGALAASVAMGTFARRWSRRRRARRHSAELSALLDAVRVMAGELRAGAHPAAAAASAATGDSRAHRMLGSVAAAAALGAEIPAMLERRSAAEPVLASEIRRVASAWSLADRHGAALAELMDAVRVDLEARVRQAGQVNAQLAGPRATAAVLAGLPLLGVLMGQGIGADPWHVLSATALGQMLLVLGVGLSCAGTLWSGWITSRGTAG